MRIEKCANISAFAEASLYRFTSEHLHGVQVLNNVAIGNGLTWNEVTRKFFYIDTCAANVVQFDYNELTGQLCML